VAEPVAQPGTGDEQDGIADRVPGDRKLQPRTGRVQVRTQGRRGDVHDRDVEDRHELPEQQHGQERTRPGPGGGVGGTIENSGHATQAPAAATPVVSAR
jgi:hypothetical protein